MFSPAFLGAAVSAGFSLSKVFATTLYTGNGSSRNIVSDLDFVAGEGLVWIKSRNTANVHYWYDTLRGPLNGLSSDSANAESANANSLTSFNADGFSVGSFGGVNTNADPLVAWQFMKAQGFFDIVEYVGNGVAGRTVALDLDGGTAVFGMSIVKRTDVAGSWAVQHMALPATDFILLNATSASSGLYSIWDDIRATTTTLTVGTDAAVNSLGGTYISYNFAHNPTKGIFCGSYTGTGSAGNKITTGFPVGWLLVKNTTSARNWSLVDNVRGELNSLLPNTSNAELVLDFWDLLSDGFEISTANPTNASNNKVGDNYIFMAIADPAQF